MAGAEAPATVVETVWRIESARLIAALARMVGAVGLAEDLAQDALLAALEAWPESGVPENPGAWLMATAKNRAIDLIRRNASLERKQQELARDLESALSADGLETEVDEVGDDLLRLVFICCHPLLSADAQV